LAAEHPAAEGEIYNLTDGKVHTVKEIITAICKALGKEAPKLHLPVKLVSTCAGVFEDVSKTLGFRSSISRSTIEKFLEESGVSGDKIQRELGFKPQYNLWTGWREIVQEMNVEK
jgi:nucleoside-diphosphate-sugar epimerase